MRITSINRVCFLFNHMFFKGTYFLEGKATENDFLRNSEIEIHFVSVQPYNKVQELYTLSM